MAGPAADRGPARRARRVGPVGPVSILLAEHEPDVAEMSARYLRADGFAVRLVTTPENALAQLTCGPHAPGGPHASGGPHAPDGPTAPHVLDGAAVLDLTMPGLDPRRIRRALRTPVIFLVSGPRPRGLARAGARHWLSRPFSPRQLVEMVRDVVVRPEQEPPAGRNAGGLRLDGPSRSAVADGDPVPLTATEFAILAAMMDHPGRVLSRRSLLAAAGRPAAADRAADVHIVQLRAKIGSAAVIRTVRGAGYVLDPVQGGQ